MEWKISACDDQGPSVLTRTLPDGRTIVLEAHDDYWVIGGTADHDFGMTNFSNLDKAIAASMTVN